MILTVDIGNSNVVLGGFREAFEPEFVDRLPSDRSWFLDQWHAALKELLAPYAGEIEGCALSSVVPELTVHIRSVLEQLTRKEVLVIDSSFQDGLELVNYDRTKLGNDRVVDLLSALAHYPVPIAIFDLGTATTLSVLDEAGRFIGGMILPGIQVSVNALSAQASQLPVISLGPPKSLLGTDTVSCMQNGAIYGAAAQIDGLTERIEALLGQSVTVVLTGGLSRLISPYCKHPLYCDTYLLLKGLRHIYLREFEHK